MASAAQILANRANAQKSTGPRTAEGKRRSSMNALKTGLTAETLVLPHENEIEYQEMRGSLYTQYQPATPQECMLVDQLASAWWRTIRIRQIETDMLDLQIQTLKAKHRTKKSSPKSDRQALACRFITESEKDFSNFLRYDANTERCFYRALNHLEKLQAARRREERVSQTSGEEIGFVSHSQIVSEPRPQGSGISVNEPRPQGSGIMPTVNEPRPKEAVPISVPEPPVSRTSRKEIGFVSQVGQALPPADPMNSAVPHARASMSEAVPDVGRESARGVESHPLIELNCAGV